MIYSKGRNYLLTHAPKTGGMALMLALVSGIPYVQSLRIEFDRRGDELTATPESPPRLSKTIDFTVDYLRSDLPRDAYARAWINRSGRRFASVHAEAWQDNRSKLFAQGTTGHFVMPELNDGANVATRDRG